MVYISCFFNDNFQVSDVSLLVETQANYGEVTGSFQLAWNGGQTGMWENILI